jgi:hypothetical protein
MERAHLQLSTKNMHLDVLAELVCTLNSSQAELSELSGRCVTAKAAVQGLQWSLAKESNSVEKVKVVLERVISLLN